MLPRRVGPRLLVAFAIGGGGACRPPPPPSPPPPRAGGASPPSPPPPVVRVATLQTRAVEQTREWLATLDGATNAEIRLRVSGYILSVDYQEGSVVRSGAPLFTIDDRPFVAALARARGD